MAGTILSHQVKFFAGSVPKPATGVYADPRVEYSGLCVEYTPGFTARRRAK